MGEVGVRKIVQLIFSKDVGLTSGIEVNLPGLAQSGQAQIALCIAVEIPAGDRVLLGNDSRGTNPVDDLVLIAEGGCGVG